MKTVTINGEHNLVCFFSTEQLEEKRRDLEEFCCTIKEKYGSGMDDETFRFAVKIRRRITRELNDRRLNKTRKRIQRDTRKPQSKQALTDNQVHKWLSNI